MRNHLHAVKPNNWNCFPRNNFWEIYPNLSHSLTILNFPSFFRNFLAILCVFFHSSLRVSSIALGTVDSVEIGRIRLVLGSFHASPVIIGLLRGVGSVEVHHSGLLRQVRIALFKTRCLVGCCRVNRADSRGGSHNECRGSRSMGYN